MAKPLLDLGANINKKLSGENYYVTVENGDLVMAALFFENGADVLASGYKDPKLSYFCLTALQRALNCCFGEIQLCMVKLLIEYGAILPTYLWSETTLHFLHSPLANDMQHALTILNHRHATYPDPFSKDPEGDLPPVLPASSRQILPSNKPSEYGKREEQCRENRRSRESIWLMLNSKHQFRTRAYVQRMKHLFMYV